jgi:hypothetical protein
MPTYSIETQKMIVAACTMHNYVCAHDREYIHLSNVIGIRLMCQELWNAISGMLLLPNAPEPSGADMDAFRDEISTVISLEMMMSKAC